MTEEVYANLEIPEKSFYRMIDELKTAFDPKVPYRPKNQLRMANAVIAHMELHIYRALQIASEFDESLDPDSLALKYWEE